MSKVYQIEIETWFLKKKHCLRKNGSNKLDGIILRETEKAIYFKINPVLVVFSDLFHEKLWVPKSLIINLQEIKNVKNI